MGKTQGNSCLRNFPRYLSVIPAKAGIQEAELPGKAPTFSGSRGKPGMTTIRHSGESRNPGKPNFPVRPQPLWIPGQARDDGNSSFRRKPASREAELSGKAPTFSGSRGKPGMTTIRHSGESRNPGKPNFPVSPRLLWIPGQARDDGNSSFRRKPESREAELPGKARPFMDPGASPG